MPQEDNITDGSHQRYHQGGLDTCFEGEVASRALRQLPLGSIVFYWKEGTAGYGHRSGHELLLNTSTTTTSMGDYNDVNPLELKMITVNYNML